ncbi:MAG: AIR carboxylase family protein, partial [Candidatus Cloacimonetes bacterium]|nr:AIR carboxylase family protein [Candidatus Cloacimonadota bacterium]
VFIACAGMAAHLPGVIASHTTLPVIGVPLKGSTLSGEDALFSVVQMPPGVPVATVAINGTKNAAVLAAQILALTSEEIKNKLIAYKKKLAEG